MPSVVIERNTGESYGIRFAEPETVYQASNVLLEPWSLGRRRPSLATISLTSGPGSTVSQLARHQPATDYTATEMWAFASGGTYRRVASTWSSVSLIDSAVAPATARPHTATYNGNLYIAYDSSVNRLHVWDGTAVRRVGIEASAAATVANTGAGAYAATLRYYKIQFQILSGSDVIASSELSAAVSFTPSGGGTAARVTKPTTPDSATHWIVYGSSDGVTYYTLNSATAVATTTYDDSATPSAYSSGTIAPTVGLYVPPPSCKYLLSTDNRLFMAGAWETTATSTQTGVKNSRVWFTQVNGALDETGEAEAIAQTTTTKDWIDVGENDGDTITGLGGPIDGVIYVFKQRSAWRLVPTGLADTPYRADRAAGVGADAQESIALGEDGAGRAAIYFASYDAGPKRMAASGSVEHLGRDVVGMYGTPYPPSRNPVVVWDAPRRVVWWIGTGGTALAYQPDFESRGQFGLRGGWTTHTIFVNNGAPGCALMMRDPSTGGESLFVGGADEFLLVMTGSSNTDGSSKVFTSQIQTHIYRPRLDGLVRARRPLIVATGNAGAYTVLLTGSIGTPFGAPTGSAPSSSGTAITTAYTNYAAYMVQETAEAVALGDLAGFQIAVTWPTSEAATGIRPALIQVVVPYEFEGTTV